MRARDAILYSSLTGKSGSDLEVSKEALRGFRSLHARRIMFRQAIAAWKEGL